MHEISITDEKIGWSEIVFKKITIKNIYLRVGIALRSPASLCAIRFTVNIPEENILVNLTLEHFV